MDEIVKPKARLNLNASTIVPLPNNPTDALSNPVWHKAMTDEYHALIKNQTWELTPRLPDMHIIRSMWLFKHKFISDGPLERYKARNLQETVYMYQPMGFRDKNFPNHGSQVAYLLLYVDDILLVTSSDTLRATLMSHLAKEFAMKDLDPLSFFLGIFVKRHKNSMFLSQQAYGQESIQRAGMTSCNPVHTPVDTHAKLSANVGTDFHDPTLYRSLAGALQYLTFTRPDISYAVQQICIHMHAPKTDHWNALKRIIRYIQGTTSFGLALGPSTSPQLIAYTDTDWAGCPNTHRSTSGYCVYYGDNPISWSSKRQATISRSSAEAEYRGVASVVAEVCWLRNLLLELQRPLSRATFV
ncbi:uncharacterized mitochondrial protein AtMg00810-like [Helianthus annuus]|uniref:uncharacterized mitochondrial protein AtMg00810-like n=1 Tax=Helianthus annuus TaxID=4232 RepID=UPI000B8FD66B|nr:uncharacterized mitochondrial protein AtMg00810-like [Helianthus annuus]